MKSSFAFIKQKIIASLAQIQKIRSVSHVRIAAGVIDISLLLVYCTHAAFLGKICKSPPRSLEYGIKPLFLESVIEVMISAPVLTIFQISVCFSAWNYYQ